MQFNIIQPLDKVKEETLNAIDKLAGETRALFLTVSQGQELTYLIKIAEAKSFPNAPTPWIDLEASETGKTTQELVQVILKTSQKWEQVGSQIEAARIKAKQTIKNSVSVKEMYDAKAALQLKLNELINGSY